MKTASFHSRVKPVSVTIVLLMIACLTCVIPHSTAMAQWVRQSPYPYHPVTGWEIDFTPSSGEGCITGDGGAPLETKDGGVTWSEMTIGNTPETRPNAVYFLDDSHGWMVGNSGWQTVDGGQSWQQMTGLPAGSWYHVYFTTATVGFAGGNAGLYKTVDGGDHWSTTPFSYPSFRNVYDIEFFGTQLGLMCVGSDTPGANGVYRTTNGGQSWTQVWSGAAGDILWLNATTVIVDTNFGTTLIRSTNGGQSFVTLNPPTTALGRPFSPGGSVVLATAVDYYGSGTFDPLVADGKIWRSTDSGTTWTPVNAGPGRWIFQHGAFLTPTTGFVVGNNNLILRTDDAGLTWRYVSNGVAKPWSAVAMLDDRRGVVCGGDGWVMSTQDGGTTWTPSNPGLALSHGDTLLSLSIVKPNFVIASGLFGTMVRSFDGGLTWEAARGPGVNGTADSWAIEFVTPQEGWISTGNIISHTTDGGTNWTQQYSGLIDGFYNAYDLEFKDAQHGWAPGYPGYVLRTDNGGQTWAPIIPTSSNAVWRSISMVDTQTGWVAGYHGISAIGLIARTTDGGLHWQSQTVPPVLNILTIHARNADEAWAATAHGNVLHTTDGGANWSIVTTGFEGTPATVLTYQGLTTRPNGAVWIVSSPGDIIHLPGMTVPGDINGDGVTNTQDIPMFIAVLLGTDQDAGHRAACDLNQDGAADGLDTPVLVGLIAH